MSLTVVYSYFNLRQWKIIHDALRHYYATNHRMIDKAQATKEEITEIRKLLPSQSDYY
jgi:hypothetical protein